MLLSCLRGLEAWRSRFRLAELAGLRVADVDLRDRIVYVVGKASRRSGPRRPAVPLDVKAARALDRYLRERRRHPYADTSRLWLGSRGRPALAADGVDAMRLRAPGRRHDMRVMFMIKGDPEPGAAPSEKLLTAMGRYNDDLKKAGVLLDLAGLLPSAEGRRVKFAEGNQVQSMDEAVEWAKRAPFEALSRIYPGEYGATGEIEIRRVFELEGLTHPPGIRELIAGAAFP